MRLVLDTNVWIDWLVFNDSSMSAIKAALRAGQIHIMSNAACLEEFTRVLAYSEFSLDEAQQQQLLEVFLHATVRHEARCPDGHGELPRCADPDDQKFVYLAHDASADWLLTRDKALLKLKRRLVHRSIRVGSPVEWAQHLSTRIKVIQPK